MPNSPERAVRADRVRSVVLEALAAVREEGKLADRTLSWLLRRETDLWSNERRRASEIVYAFLRHEILLTEALERALTESGTERLQNWPQSVVANALLEAHLLLGGETLGTVSLPSSLRNAVLQTGPSAQRLIAEAPAGPARLSLEQSVPLWLAERLCQQLGVEEAQGLLHALNQRGPLTLRANLLKGEVEGLGKDLLAEEVESHPTPYSPWGRIVDSHPNVFALLAFRKGLFEVQDEGSQLLALLCGARPGQLVVDACAGAGGKSLALAAEMKNRGEIWALDSSARRLEQLAARAKRAGTDNLRLQPIAESGDLPPPIERLRGRAQLVLVDAPCSGIGALRRNPDARRRLSPAEIADHGRRQLEILRRMSALVRPGGRLVYATCSPLEEENEAIVKNFLEEGAPFDSQSAGVTLGQPLWQRLTDPLPPLLRSPHALKLWPHHHGTDGFFGLVLVRRGD